MVQSAADIVRPFGGGRIGLVGCAFVKGNLLPHPQNVYHESTSLYSYSGLAFGRMVGMVANGGGDRLSLLVLMPVLLGALLNGAALLWSAGSEQIFRAQLKEEADRP